MACVGGGWGSGQVVVSTRVGWGNLTTVTARTARTHAHGTYAHTHIRTHTPHPRALLAFTLTVSAGDVMWYPENVTVRANVLCMWDLSYCTCMYVGIIY